MPIPCHWNLGGDIKRGAEPLLGTVSADFCFRCLNGYDGIVVQGKSDKPVYLFIHDGICEIRDASYLWGKGVIKVREKLKDEYYALRGWDITSGWQTMATLRELRLEDIARELEQRELIAEG
ncbi:aldehyde ferredoxin oxidoreductase N-terminal domain-containing protein [Chloroflexota bacterium]